MKLRLTQAVGALLAVVVALTLAGPSLGTTAVWFQSTPVTTTEFLQSGSVQVATPGAAASGKTADWSGTPVTLTGSTAAVGYAELSAPTPAISNTGPLPVRYGIVAAVTRIGGTNTTEAGAKALAAKLKASFAVIAAGSACTETSFNAGAVLTESTLNPIGAVSGTGITNPIATAAPTFSVTTGRALAVGASDKLCARYEVPASGTAGAGTWGRTVSVTYTLQATNAPSGTWTSEVSWTQAVRMMVPAPVAQTGTSAQAACEYNYMAWGWLGDLTLNWGWPSSSVATSDSPTTFTVRALATDYPVAGTKREWAAPSAVVSSILSRGAGTTDFTVQALAADGTSSAMTVRLVTNFLGRVTSCSVI